MRWLFALLVGATFAFAAPAALAGDPNSFVAVVPDGESSGPEGSVDLLTTMQTPPHLIGAECSVTVNVFNNTSLHEENDLLVTSGATEAVAEDVESVVGDSSYPAVGTVTLDSTVTVSIRYGPDEIRSEGYDVVLDCTPEPPPPPECPDGQSIGYDGKCHDDPHDCLPNDDGTPSCVTPPPEFPLPPPLVVTPPPTFVCEPGLVFTPDGLGCMYPPVVACPGFTG